MSKLFPELIEGILLWLPVKTLLRFRCVSKSLSTLIDSPYFINSHITTSIQTKIRKKFILQYKRDLVCSATDFIEGIESIELRKPSKTTSDLFRIIGSCNGLILLRKDYDFELNLWNPFTHQYKILPGPGSLFSPEISFCAGFGFGYDAASDDYKVVRFENRGWVKPGVVWIYSLKSNSWRISSHKYLPCFNDFFIYLTSIGFLVNNALHWLCLAMPGYLHLTSIMAFDISTEKFHRLQLPSDLVGCDAQLDVLDGRLCLNSIKLVDGYKVEIDFYVGDKNGELVTWSKLDKVKFEVNGFYNYLTLKLKPLWYSKDGNKILIYIDERNVFWYDHKEKTVENVRNTFCVRPYYGHGHSTVCFESLVSLGYNDTATDMALCSKQLKMSKILWYMFSLCGFDCLIPD